MQSFIVISLHKFMVWQDRSVAEIHAASEIMITAPYHTRIHQNNLPSCGTQKN